MSRRNEEHTIQQEIDSLIEELADLRFDFQRRSEHLSDQLNTLQARQNQTRVNVPVRGNPFALQDRVRITNNYRNLKGTEGVVVRVTRRQVTLRAEDLTEHTRSYRNVELIQGLEQEDHGFDGAAQ
jgi:hypothetical protein